MRYGHHPTLCLHWFMGQVQSLPSQCHVLWLGFRAAIHRVRRSLVVVHVGIVSREPFANRFLVNHQSPNYANDQNILTQTLVYSTATLAGAIIAYVWAKRNPKSFDIYGYAVAAGMIAGEGIGGKHLVCKKSCSMLTIMKALSTLFSR